jgi:hypothetical protein
VRATLLLCDYAVVAEGKLFISGGGWSLTGPEPSPSAIAIKIDVPWDRTNEQIPFTLALVDEDEEPVTTLMPAGTVPIEVNGSFEVGRPPGVRPGSTIDTPLAMNFPPIPLTPDRRYVWKLKIGDEEKDEWRLSFATRPLRPGQ